eukprot:TRINITY_DN318_c0_g1_i1.p1 TRINITY_DN318_c0_g1~~TRINITY_DN318_c0_g1_i1.p1  ORF type:complete len:452 (-),score=51.80 TRINITY_DN318_c0_g1_i1:135-1490(-)
MEEKPSKVEKVEDPEEKLAEKMEEKPSKVEKAKEPERRFLGRNEFFMAVADLARQKSSDTRTQVGCCIIDGKTREIISIGYNGFAAKIELEPDQLKKENKTEHLQCAELNALHFGAERLSLQRELVVYTTMFPCHRCTVSLIQKRVEQIHFNVSCERYSKESLPILEATGTSYANMNDLHFDDTEKGKEKFLFVRTPNSTSHTNPAECKNCPQGNCSEEDKVIHGRPETKLSWDDMFMSIAVLAEMRCSEQSKTNPYSGCCIAKGSQILGYGFTGKPQLLRHKDSNIISSEGLDIRDSVANALSFCGDVTEATMYLSVVPSSDSLMQCVQRGIKMIYYSRETAGRNLNEINNLAAKYPIGLRKFHSQNLLTFVDWENFGPITHTYGHRISKYEITHLKSSNDAIQKNKNWTSQTPNSINHTSNQSRTLRSEEPSSPPTTKKQKTSSVNPIF